MRSLLSMLLVMLLASLACEDTTPTMPTPAELPLLAARRSWSPSSVPAPYRTADGPINPLDSTDRGLLVWFSHPAVVAEEFYPSLAGDAREKTVPTLELLFNPRANVDSWCGLVVSIEDKPLDPNFIGWLELWVNDFVPWTHRENRRGELRIDIGRVSEDAVWDPRVPPVPENGVLDYEDRDQSGGRIAFNEDLGLDGLRNTEEEYDTTRLGGDPDTDPAGDDRVSEVGPFFPEDTAEQRLLVVQGINGREGNRLPDSEDLNGDWALQTENDYHEFLVDLSRSAPLDVVRDFEDPVRPERNGWRRYLIPFSDPHDTVGNPDGNFIRHIRIWLRGTEPDNLMDLQIAGFRILGPNGSVLLGEQVPGSPEP